MFFTIRGWLCILLSMLLVVPPVLAADAVAMVTDLKGEARLTENGSTDRLQLLAYLAGGAEIEVAKDARVVITYFSSPQEYVFTGPAKIRIEAAGPQSLAGNVVQTRKLEQDSSGVMKKFSSMQREKLYQATYEMRGARPGLRLIGPIDTSISTLQPEFAWSGPNNASAYRFSLSDSAGRTLKTFKTRKSGWQVSGSALLKYGNAYRWKVETSLDSGETLSAAGSFKVLGKAGAMAIAAARPGPDADFTERVLYAARLETAGLAYQAKKEWQVLAHERPDNPVLQEKAVQ